MDLSARIGTVTTAEPFVIARGTEEVNEVLWVELGLDGTGAWRTRHRRA